MTGSQHVVEQGLRRVGQHQTRDAVDTHEKQPEDEQACARRYQGLNLRPELFEAGFALGKVGLPGARATPVGHALGAHAAAHSGPPHGSHRLDQPLAARRDERTHTKNDVDEEKTGHHQLGGEGDLIR